MDLHPALLLGAPAEPALLLLLLLPLPPTPPHANWSSRASRAPPCPGARRLNRVMQMLSLHAGDLLGLPWQPAPMLQTFIQPYGIKDYL